MTEEQVTEPTEDEPASEEEVAAEESEETLEAEGESEDEGDAEDEAEAEPEGVEVEIDGQKYMLPPGVEKYIRDKDADYTRKTQTVAEQRRELEARQEELNQRAQAVQQLTEEKAEVLRNRKTLKSFEEYFNSREWSELQQNDMEQAQRLALQYQTLHGQTSRLAEEIEQKEQQERLRTQRETAERRERLTADLARDIPNYSPELQEKLVTTATNLGFEKKHLDEAVDPRVWRMLHLAHLGEQVLKRQKSAVSPKKVEPVKPVSKAGKGKSAPSGPDDRMSTEAWIAAERKRMARRAGA